MHLNQVTCVIVWHVLYRHNGLQKNECICSQVTCCVLVPQEAGPSIKRTKTSDDSGLDMDNAAENGGGDSVIDGGASEIELVFRPHPTLMEKDDGHNRCVHSKTDILFFNHQPEYCTHC